VKPSNLVTVGSGLIKVTDFGIARAASDGGIETGPDILGTPCFMSPEQVLDQPVDFRSDIYSLGLTLYFFLTGAPPYDGDDGVEVALRQVHDPVPTLSAGSRRVSRLLSKMLAKSPDARHDSYDELISEIRGML
jgi:serine/threonine-protein kinase